MHKVAVDHVERNAMIPANSWQEVARPSVAVLMIAYNHEKYIRESIEGVLMQRGDFELRLILGEDCGTDKTRLICEEYARSRPDVITLLPSDRNYGVLGNVLRVLKECLRSDYVAFCEGDDKWTDPGKLQHQVDFLGGHPEFAAHSHNVIVRNLIGGQDSEFGSSQSSEFSFDDLFNSWSCHAVSLMARSGVLRSICEQKLPHFISADRFINRWIACHGRMYYDGERKMAVYHRHGTGASQLSNVLELRYQELEMLGFLRPFVPVANIRHFEDARVAALQEVALYSSHGHGTLKRSRLTMLLEYIWITRLARSKSLYYSLLILFGRPFYRLNERLRNREAISIQK